MPILCNKRPAGRKTYSNPSRLMPAATARSRAPTSDDDGLPPPDHDARRRVEISRRSSGNWCMQPVQVAQDPDASGTPLLAPQQHSHDMVSLAVTNFGADNGRQSRSESVV